MVDKVVWANEFCQVNADQPKTMTSVEQAELRFIKEKVVKSQQQLPMGERLAKWMNT